MFDHANILLAGIGVALLLLLVLFINNRKQRKKIKSHLIKIEELRKDAQNALDLYD